jgi:hypothetical protein
MVRGEIGELFVGGYRNPFADQNKVHMRCRFGDWFLLAILLVSLSACIMSKGLKKVNVYENLSGPQSVEIVDHYAYLADGHDGLIILDLSGPTVPTNHKMDQARDVAVANGYL